MTLVLHLVNYHSHLLQMTPTYLRKIQQLIERTNVENIHEAPDKEENAIGVFFMVESKRLSYIKHS